MNMAIRRAENDSPALETPLLKKTLLAAKRIAESRAKINPVSIISGGYLRVGQGNPDPVLS